MSVTDIPDITGTARAFFDTCNSGQGWEACRRWCHDDATFSAQADALADVTTLQGYAEWMKNLVGLLPDARYTLMAFATDPERHSVVAAAVINATHTGQGGPVSPTGRKLAADYVYVMEFDGDRIRHVTKVWNDAHSLRSLGWA